MRHAYEGAFNRRTYLQIKFHCMCPNRQASRVLSFVLVSAIVLFSCTGNKYARTNKVHRRHVKELTKQLRAQPDQYPTLKPDYWVGTTNFNLRKPSFVVIHHTAQNSCDQTLRTFTLKRTQVSAHYVICKDGIIHHMLNDYLRAWHGGIGRWGNITDINSSSIGIELDNNGYEPFDPRQIESLLILLDTLKKKYTIPQSNFIGHLDIAPTRKNDPNIYFPWNRLSERGFGNWYSDTTGIELPPTFDHLHALRVIGYDMRDTSAAIGAFKRHFVADSIPILNEQDRKILYQLVYKYY